MSGMFVTAIMGRIWLRLKWQGALTAMLVAVGTSLLIINQPLWLSYWGNPCIPAVIAALLAAIIVSLLTPPCRLNRAQALALITAQREDVKLCQESLLRETQTTISSAKITLPVGDKY